MYIISGILCNRTWLLVTPKRLEICITRAPMIIFNHLHVILLGLVLLFTLFWVVSIYAPNAISIVLDNYISC